ncbi:hypothetical protein Poli38472_004586 [Pythium oligandrum]|uniref:Serine carboxypeptidase n=1 Tax=Pythium oligandrum TaxID=41045 RepID=A0A8K1CBW5_PYTOL|nr:hypothetical protein Poli38472_004586 [Pythium oligandrum]|eukprot:TMW59517.1 hypothetical protein Poli38472_004586 [Pythium oligandrum]
MAHALDMVNNTYNVTLMSDEDYQHAKEILPGCIVTIMEIFDTGNMTTIQSSEGCDVAMTPFKDSHRNPYDIRLPCGDVADATQCYDITSVNEFLNSADVTERLNATSEKQWLECNSTTGGAFVLSGDFVENYESYVADLLNDGNIRVLSYVGDTDTVCNWYGIKAWATALDWEHKDEFNAAEEHDFLTSNGSVDAVVAKAYKNQFTFLRLYNAGHMVPRDQPAVSLEMLSKFLQGETF